MLGMLGMLGWGWWVQSPHSPRQEGKGVGGTRSIPGNWDNINSVQSTLGMTLRNFKALVVRTSASR